MADRPNIDISTLRQLLAYDPETGKLTWLPRPREMFQTNRHCGVWNARYAAQPALANTSQGYHRGNVFDQPYKAHRVAWALHHGEWPDGDIDHINGVPSDNRIANLRVVDHQTNMRNLKRRGTNTSGVTGVSWFARHQKWQVRIGASHLGYFDTLEAATAARLAAEGEQGFHPNHGRAG